MSEPPAPADTIQPNTLVTIDYELRDEDGDLLDASESEDGQPMRYVHGYGMLVPGLEGALVGLRVGDEREVIVPAESAYGEYDDDLLLELPREQLPRGQSVQVGDELVAESPDGAEIEMNVVQVHADRVVVDANHPLAGMTLRYVVRVRAVRRATDEEIQRAASDLDDAHEQVFGPDCEHEAQDVLRIGHDAN